MKPPHASESIRNPVPSTGPASFAPRPQNCYDFANWTSRRAVEAVDQHLEYLAEQEEDKVVPNSDEALASELQRQLRDLDLIAHNSKELRYSSTGLPIDTSIRLRVELRTPLSSRA
ncbi:hypothetical protein ABZ707_32995 [Streptomyces sp. NPDC006923]|uniref:hypothetical protein n=1 Tax=Streptomyces sp. NPDC006923 TaxID=3155355 RepID=UPI00340F640B